MKLETVRAVLPEVGAIERDTFCSNALGDGILYSLFDENTPNATNFADDNTITIDTEYVEYGFQQEGWDRFIHEFDNFAIQYPSSMTPRARSYGQGVDFKRDEETGKTMEWSVTPYSRDYHSTETLANSNIEDAIDLGMAVSENSTITVQGKDARYVRFSEGSENFYELPLEVAIIETDDYIFIIKGGYYADPEFKTFVQTFHIADNFKEFRPE